MASLSRRATDAGTEVTRNLPPPAPGTCSRRSENYHRGLFPNCSGSGIIVRVFGVGLGYMRVLRIRIKVRVVSYGTVSRVGVRLGLGPGKRMCVGGMC